MSTLAWSSSALPWFEPIFAALGGRLTENDRFTMPSSYSAKIKLPETSRFLREWFRAQSDHDGERYSCEDGDRLVG